MPLPPLSPLRGSPVTPHRLVPYHPPRMGPVPLQKEKLKNKQIQHTCPHGQGILETRQSTWANSCTDLRQLCPPHLARSCHLGRLFRSGRVASGGALAPEPLRAIRVKLRSAHIFFSFQKVRLQDRKSARISRGENMSVQFLGKFKLVHFLKQKCKAIWERNNPPK